jgi:hypothetical protein
MTVVRTRRELLGRAALIGAMGSAGTVLLFGDALASTETQTQALSAIFEVELLVQFAYQRVLNAGVLGAGAARTAAAFLAHEQSHAQVLTTWLLKMGVAPPPPLELPAADAALGKHNISGTLDKLTSERDALMLLGELESVAEGAYYLGIAHLTDPQLLQSAAQMMANEAQHATILSELLHPGDISRAVPAAFVQGMP